MYVLLFVIANACPDSCTDDLLNNDSCDEACYTTDCYLDLEDCACNCSFPTEECLIACQSDYCAEDCPSENIGDSYCDMSCNVQACSFDGNDCIVNCQGNCKYDDIGDGTCDSDCNVEECDYDDGDCGSEDDMSIAIVATVIGFVVSLFVCAVISVLSYCLARRFNRFSIHPEQTALTETMPLTLQALDSKFPVQEYYSSIIEFSDKCCAVCLDE
mmetsp:Transcript_26355/g.47304  ORF Transcript_26355/g.47304 Transcript_26355/m.47304 type:complete len:215 (+) Transcript_26355:2242-2886(+)